MRGFPDFQGKKVLLLGIGGGGDAAGALPVYSLLRESGAFPQIGGLTWKRTLHDPKGLPRGICEFENITPVSTCIGLARPDSRLKEGIVHMEADVSAALNGEEVLILDIGPGVDKVRSCLESYVNERGIDCVIGADVGGDALCRGDEPTICSPLCDQVMLSALSGFPKAILSVIGLGSDGELPLESFCRRFDDLADAGAYGGAVFLTPERTALCRAALASAKSESSIHAVRIADSLSSEEAAGISREMDQSKPEIRRVLQSIEHVKMRNGTRVGELTCLSAFMLFFDLGKVYETGLFRNFLSGSADIFELDRIFTRMGYVTEMTDKARDL